MMYEVPLDALDEIRRIANKHHLAVSVVTPEDVLDLKGLAFTPENIDAVVGSWEWRHYGDNWADFFELFEIGEDK